MADDFGRRLSQGSANMASRLEPLSPPFAHTTTAQSNSTRNSDDSLVVQVGALAHNVSPVGEAKRPTVINVISPNGGGSTTSVLPIAASESSLDRDSKHSRNSKQLSSTIPGSVATVETHCPSGSEDVTSGGDVMSGGSPFDTGKMMSQSAISILSQSCLSAPSRQSLGGLSALCSKSQISMAESQVSMAASQVSMGKRLSLSQLPPLPTPALIRGETQEKLEKRNSMQPADSSKLLKQLSFSRRPSVAHSVSTVDGAQRFVEGLDQNLQYGSKSLPERVLEKKNFLSWLAPRFTPGVESSYIMFEQARMQEIVRPLSVIIVCAAFLGSAGLLSEVLLKEAFNTHIFEIVNHSICIGLLLIWLGILQWNASKATLSLHCCGRISVYTVEELRCALLSLAPLLLLCHFLFWQLAAALSVAMEDDDRGSRTFGQSAGLAWSVLALQLFGALPIPALLAPLLIVVNVAPCGWIYIAYVSIVQKGYQGLNTSAVFCVWLSGITCFIAQRNAMLRRRKHFLLEELRQAERGMSSIKIQEMQQEIKELETIPTSDDFLHQLLKAHRKRVADLQQGIQDKQAKRKICKLHAELVKEYVHQATFPQHSKPSMVKISAYFDMLRKNAEEESLRISSAMGEIYDEFTSDPNWHVVTKCPSFGDVSTERLHQKHHCHWWSIHQLEGRGSKDQAELLQKWMDDTDRKIGLVNDRLQYFASRALWARGPLAKTLVDVVRRINSASSVQDLGLDPVRVLEAWNYANPTHQLADIPFPANMAFRGSVPLAASLQHESLEYGEHAALQMGPNKRRARAEAKVAEFTDLRKYPDQDCPEKYICDWLRARVIFSNPATLAAFFWYLASGETSLSVVVCKNKLLNRPGEDTSVNIHLNVQFGVQDEYHIAEVQLLLEPFILAKDLEHCYYEYRRAAQPVDLLAPVFAQEEDGSDDEASQTPKTPQDLN